MNEAIVLDMNKEMKRESVIVLLLVSAMNILNYFHRYLPSATKVLIQKEIKLSDFESGALFTSFIVSYMVVSPLIGLVGDRGWIKRKYLVVLGVVLWSVATSCTALAHNFATLVIPRLLFGVGEAIFGTLSTPLLCDFFPPSQRNMVMALFNAGIPIGCALGYGIAGVMGDELGWRMTFGTLGLLGVLSLPILWIREPRVGELDQGELDGIGYPSGYERIDEENIPLLPDQYAPPPKRFPNPVYLVAVMGFVGVTFGMGGFSDWLPAFFNRYYGMSVEEAGFINGMIVVLGGLLGAVIGGLVTDWVTDHVTRRHPYFLVASVSTLITTILATVALYACQGILGLAMVLLGFATFFGWFYCGAINSIIVNSVPPEKRALANGLCILMIHMCGDAISPSIIGLISDAQHGDLRSALFIVPVSFGFSILVWFGGFVFIPMGRV